MVSCRGLRTQYAHATPPDNDGTDEIDGDNDNDDEERANLCGDTLDAGESSSLSALPKSCANNSLKAGFLLFTVVDGDLVLDDDDMSDNGDDARDGVFCKKGGWSAIVLFILS